MFYTEDPSPVLERLRVALNVESVGKWNDAPERTFAEVLDALKKADV